MEKTFLDRQREKRDEEFLGHGSVLMEVAEILLGKNPQRTAEHFKSKRNALASELEELLDEKLAEMRQADFSNEEIIDVLLFCAKIEARKSADYQIYGCMVTDDYIQYIRQTRDLQRPALTLVK